MWPENYFIIFERAKVELLLKEVLNRYARNNLALIDVSLIDVMIQEKLSLPIWQTQVVYFAYY
jgi:hypothetical protein